MQFFRTWFWPDVAIRRKAQGAIDEAFWVAIGVSTIAALMALVGSREGIRVGALLEALFLAFVALGIRLRMRSAAVLALVLFVADRVYLFFAFHPLNVLLYLAISLALLNGVRGTFAYRRLPPKPADMPTIEQAFQRIKQLPPSEQKPNS